MFGKEKSIRAYHFYKKKITNLELFFIPIGLTSNNVRTVRRLISKQYENCSRDQSPTKKSALTEQICVLK